ncbi:FlxA-like family protein [Paenibacillus sp. sgz5001063]|uniref:FlxA-like family protein n=1 Tax=Paenibacillus sp. sgz5001063 TaxID=3242474 RepID=UPI0036D32C13
MSSISSISSNSTHKSTSANPATTSLKDKEIQNLLDRKSKLNEEIQAVKTNDKLNFELKQERIQSLNSSIQDIDAQITQIKAEQMQEKKDRNQQDQAETKKPEPDITDLSMDVLKNSMTYDKLGMLVGINKRLEGSIATLKIEAKLNGSRHSAGSTDDSGKQIQDIKSKIKAIDYKIGDLLGEMNNKIDNKEDLTRVTRPEDRNNNVQNNSSEETSASSEEQPILTETETPPTLLSIDIRV